ncbi:MAG TPA: helix-turn-helix domain-containing protein [Marinagarivorans sp.]|nr:helix-turn-helix domain-containing protein [Cellvibrionaceae bacterium]HMY40413.1 helix-turn-helix domain-containing protein [Marinagarivorans sp.]HNG59388.1 helix-turn-helix domain-containing protein [Cellvibrionaceae bacterium]
MIESQKNSVMTLDELASYLKVPKSTLYKLVQDGKVPGQKVGKQWRFAKASIDRWLAAEAPTKGAI